MTATPATVRLLVVTAPLNDAAVTMPERVTFFHLLAPDPRLCVSSSVGIRLDPNSPPTVMVSVSASPSPIAPPLKVTTPTNSE